MANEDLLEEFREMRVEFQAFRDALAGLAGDVTTGSVVKAMLSGLAAKLRSR